MSNGRTYSQAEIDRAKKAVAAVTDFVNGDSQNIDLFAQLMENEHRTLQQLFTKLSMRWIENIARPDYRTDGRNIHSQQTAQKLMKGWKLLRQQDEKETYEFQPSQWLPLV